jgi:hypothetical protein
LLSRQHCRTKLAHGITDLGKGLLRPFQFTLERVALDYDGAELLASKLPGAGDIEAASTTPHRASSNRAGRSHQRP